MPGNSAIFFDNKTVSEDIRKSAQKIFQNPIYFMGKRQSDAPCILRIDVHIAL